MKSPRVLDPGGRAEHVNPVCRFLRLMTVNRHGCGAYHGRAWVFCAFVFVLTACDGPQSALAPAGVGASRLAQLFWAMLIGAGLIWALVVGFAMYVTRIRPQAHSERMANGLILWGGVVFPVTVLAMLLTYGLTLMPSLRASDDGLRIAVSGEQWWWRVRYFPPGAREPIASANEVRLPVGQKVEIALTSPDVIHSFWIPSLAGKVDMIPGRTNRIVLEPTKPGVYRGACAEYCGTSHALMAFSVVVMTKTAFGTWLEMEGTSAATEAKDGRDLFLATGCGACHTIRGTQAVGVIGPDLTHVGNRRSIGAGILPNNAASLAHFIARTQHIKPGVLMPSFGMLPADEIKAIAVYLKGLE